MSIFSFFLTESKHAENVSIPELSNNRIFGEYTFYTDGSTPYCFGADGNTACALFGLAVDVISGASDDIAAHIAKNCKGIHAVVEYEKNLGGKYILLYKHGDQYYIQGDATCSIPVFYNTDGVFMCSSNAQYIVNLNKYCADREFALIRRGGEISQAMPYDITPYREVKQLIPNHYLHLNERTAVRFVNSTHKQRKISVEEATNLAIPMIDNILALYLRHYKIYCPITAGRDSRVVLAFLLKHKVEFSCYTIKHPNHSDNAQDITVPVALCGHIGIKHQLVEDVTVPEELKDAMDAVLGAGKYSPRTLQIAQTVKEFFGDGAIINGDIIGQVGKCSLHRDIPAIFATASYFRCKLHNYSKGAKEQLKLWLREIKTSGEQINTFDLFSIENRMGRWASQENIIYNTIEQIYLNIFNCRSVIYIWTAVDRSDRKLSKLHIGLINATNANLSCIPFEKEEGIVVKLSKATGMTYLLSSYVKFFIEKRKFKKGGRA